MLSSSALWASFLMGVFGGPHCLLMCGGACAALSQRTPQQPALQRALSFQIRRLLGYGVLGAVGALSMQTVGALSTKVVILQPVWNFIHVIGLFSGLYLLIFAFQPIWLDQGARHLWRGIQSSKSIQALMSWRTGPLLLGSLWALLPCGLLYSALMLSSLTASPLTGWLTMMSFALGSGLSLWIAQWTLQLIQDRSILQTQPTSQSQERTTQVLTWVHLRESMTQVKPNRAWPEKFSRLGFRICGLALVLYCTWLLYSDTVLQHAPWCASQL